ncbi:MAG: DUF721 domain-containing protein [Leptospiraceae bacterium]|nr:DUF721 domain-containing protein [Leptospiraceae bacterium]MDW8305496.1 DUF721 domain-containing protein [Leptospiraceae bacterium]
MIKVNENLVLSLYEKVLTKLRPELREKLLDLPRLWSLQENWSKAVGEILAAHSVPTRIHTQTLFVATENSIYAQEILLHQRIILKKLEELCNLHIKNIRTYQDKNPWRNHTEKRRDIISKPGNVGYTEKKKTPDLEEEEIKAYLETLKQNLIQLREEKAP